MPDIVLYFFDRFIQFFGKHTKSLILSRKFHFGKNLGRRGFR